MTSSPHPAIPLTASTLQLSAEAGRVLLAEARAAMAAQLGQPAPPTAVAAAAAWLRQPAATHVTLTLEGKLRGAAGAPPARQALREDLRNNALAAAFHDPRFKAITSNELDALRIEVSVLSPLETLQWEDEADALA
jgi:AMMECR1 domain-containing protein